MFKEKVDKPSKHRNQKERPQISYKDMVFQSVPASQEEVALSYLREAYLKASRSKDRSTKVGAVIYNLENSIPLSNGYNGFPRGVDDKVEYRHTRPLKYSYTEHAERNAIYNCARMGIKTEGATIFVTLFPCDECARAIIQSGLKSIVFDKNIVVPELLERWDTKFQMSYEMLEEAGILMYALDVPADDLINVLNKSNINQKN